MMDLLSRHRFGAIQALAVISILQVATGFHPQASRVPFSSISSNAFDVSRVVSPIVLFGKKDKRKGGAGGAPGKSRGQQPAQEKQSVKDARFDANTRQFMFTLVGLTKVLPDKSKTILKNINLSFYPGAKIGVVGLNGSGK
jgi:ABC-type multidrug transport system fused ATPase/permease subunit